MKLSPRESPSRGGAGTVEVGGAGEGVGVAPALPPFPVELSAASAGCVRGAIGVGGEGGARSAGSSNASSGKGGAGRGSGVAGAGAEMARWRQFTPLAVDSTKCLGRTWNKGKGGQCALKPLAGGDLCGKRADKVGEDSWLGKVTGGIRRRS